MDAYARDPDVWLSLVFGVAFAAASGMLAGWILRYTSAPERKIPYVRAQAIKLAFACLFLGAMSLRIRFFQWRFGGNGDPYTAAYTVGLGLGLPIAWFFEFRPGSKVDLRS